ncbi:hypothetical protein SAMN04488020_101218 [Palleronia marisminoris]|uniref:Uncharacterized protein n=1 Tax=Palleronia marisminoris TaxID=315423 RepID=A0A1Y5RC11_9RHOB|nr:hypothetical protein SAMN04488020_101218 [Palleronia marisminoris]SLN13947.1 hypothetical protein PAM7066_00220 [Palleronia marisminoris]
MDAMADPRPTHDRPVSSMTDHRHDARLGGRCRGAERMTGTGPVPERELS